MRFDDAAASRWDCFVEGSWNGTFLHSRRYLGYHRDRFIDESVLIEDAQGKLLAVIPAARDPDCRATVISHPGITYGGLIHSGALKGERQVQAMAAVLAHYRELGLREFVYRPPPHIYHRIPSEDDQFALVRLGARLDRVYLASVIDLHGRPPLPKGRRHALRKAQRGSISALEDPTRLPELWHIVTENLRTRHAASPTHSEAQMSDLIQRFPDRIRCLVGISDGDIVGGVILYDAGPVLVTQYMASTAAGREEAVLDLLLDNCVRRAQADCKRYLSFGTSDMAAGYLNEGLHHFKCLFGAGGVAHHSFRIDLR